ncbi:unnamed protein product, partial [Ectocarpus sp. 4 AP-2014]
GWGAGVPGVEGPPSPGAVSIREDDVVHAKWLEQLRVVWQGDKKEQVEGNQQRSSPSSGKEAKQQSPPSTDEKDKATRKEGEDS